MNILLYISYGKQPENTALDQILTLFTQNRKRQALKQPEMQQLEHIYDQISDLCFICSLMQDYTGLEDQ